MLLLLLLQVLMSCLWLGHSEVVTSFQSCHKFFFQGTPPNDVLKPNNPAWICQRYNNQYYFATLYNRDLRIPVYSAYIYKPGTGTRPNIWMVEPQLIGSKYSHTMQTESDLMNQTKVTIEDIKKSQAINQDYMNLNDLNRGHLNPRCHQYDNNSMMATFTLTNIVPQNRALNGGEWNKYELETMANMSTGCTTTYVVVGAVPGNNFISGNRVNVPSHIWAGACCEINNQPSRAWAVIAENNKDAVQSLTLGELEKKLTELYKGNVSLFHDNCGQKKAPLHMPGVKGL